MDTKFPPNDQNIEKAVFAVKTMTKWPNSSIKIVNDKLKDMGTKIDDLRLIRRIKLENLEANSQLTNQFLDIQAQKHQKEIEQYKKEIEQYKEFIDFCKNDDEYKHIINAFNIYLQRKAEARSASAPPDYSKKSLMRRYRIKY